MKKIYLLLLAACTALTFKAHAQQEPIFTHYMFNQLTYNPGYAGSRDAICANALYRNQWTGFEGPKGEGSPVTQILSVHSPVSIRQRDILGAGIHIINDQNEGFISTLNVMASLAYRTTIPALSANLGIGVNFGMSQKSLAPEWKPFTTNDPRLPGASAQAIFDAGVGAWLVNPRWYAGLSMMHIPDGKIDWAQTPSTDYQLARVMYVTGGYAFPVSGALEIHPSFVYRNDLVKGVLDVSALAWYNQKFYGGLNIRTGQLYATSIMAGLMLKDNLLLSAGYDIPTSQPSIFGSTFEIMARYCFSIVIPDTPPMQIFDPRWM